MDSLDALRRTLIWVASGTGSAAFDGIDDVALFDAIHKHRLDSRLWYRLDQDETLVPRRLHDRIRARHQENLARTREQVAMYGQLRDALIAATGAGHVLPLKGFGLYALTGRDEHIRYSADVDVIGAHAPDVVTAALTVTEEGYHHHGEEHPYVFAHMGQIEVHGRYVITGGCTGRPCGCRAPSPRPP
jgi:Uncharacterised nucleotidyltransferase